MKHEDYILAQSSTERDSRILEVKHGGRVLAQSSVEWDSHILEVKRGGRVLAQSFAECGPCVLAQRRIVCFSVTIAFKCECRILKQGYRAERELHI